jgi:two-component system, NarL family, response regulator NreC
VIRLLLAEDHAVVREGLRKMIEAEADLAVVGETSDGSEVVGLVDELKPDLVLLDLSLPGLHGLEVIRQLHSRTHRSRILVLSMHAHHHYVRTALANGADGYLAKGVDSKELVCAIRSVAEGSRYLSAEVSMAAKGESEGAALAADRGYESLTRREREILRHVAEGHSNAATAARLFISERTVESHRASAMRKLGLRTTAELVRYAIRTGIVPPA